MSWAGWSGSAAPSSVCRSLAALFLIALSFILMGHDWLFGSQGLALSDLPQMANGFTAGVVIGLVSSVWGYWLGANHPDHRAGLRSGWQAGRESQPSG